MVKKLNTFCPFTKDNCRTDCAFLLIKGKNYTRPTKKEDIVGFHCGLIHRYINTNGCTLFTLEGHFQNSDFD